MCFGWSVEDQTSEYSGPAMSRFAQVVVAVVAEIRNVSAVCRLAEYLAVVQESWTSMTASAELQEAPKSTKVAVTCFESHHAEGHRSQ